MKVAVVGSRGFTNYEMMKDALDKIEISEIISGGASGADKLAERYAHANNIPTNIFLPDWSLGRRAGPLRNSEIVDAADMLVAFWDGESRGTMDSIKKAERRRIPVDIIRYK